MWRNIASFGLTFFIVALFLSGGALILAKRDYGAPGPLAEAICLEVPSGSTLNSVTARLERAEALSSPVLFRLGARYTERDTAALKAGSYIVEAGASMDEISEIVTRGGASTCGTEVVYRIGITRASVQVRELDPSTGRYVERAAFNPAEETPESYAAVRGRADTRYRVALAEGVTSWQVVQELGQIDILTGTAPVPAEGALSPDSYDLRPGDTVQSVLTRMQNAQDRILAQAWENRAEGLPYASPEEALIMASIIEKETAVPSERFEVASVFVNRLRRGIRLQTDPTVIYGITKGEGVLGRGLRRSELDRATPWNTYTIDGLPPTPIANPGRASIEAALNPADSKFIFFVAATLDPRDGHVFAETLAEHNRNVAAYRALERAQ